MIKDILGDIRSKDCIKIVMFGAGELGQEIFREAKRFGFYYLVAVDRYQNTPAGRIADKEYTFNMLNGDAMKSVVYKEQPDIIIPEIEAINTDTLVELEEEGYFVVPNARATKICMNRKLIRKLIDKKAGVKTSKYEFASTEDPKEFKDAVEKIGAPCFSKAIMSSSGKGSYFIKGENDIEKAREHAIKGARGKGNEVIIEEYIDFDTEVTELATRFDGGTLFPYPIGHYQLDGDYHSSWQGKIEEYLPYLPELKKYDEKLALEAKKKIFEAAGKITEALGGVGVFGVELFVRVKDNKVEIYGNECSPRPHDTGMVTYINHFPGLSEGGLHLKAISGRVIPYEEENGFKVIKPLGNAATHVIKSPIEGHGLKYDIGSAEKYGELYIFGKPFSYSFEDRINGFIEEERMGVALSQGRSVYEAKLNAEKAAHSVKIGNGKRWYGQKEKEMHLLK